VRIRRSRFAALAASLIAMAVFALLAGRPAMRARASNPIWRGYRLFQTEGCHGCHGSVQNGEMGNPGSRYEGVPRLGSGDLRMYAETPDDVRQWIRDGAPASLRTDAAESQRLAKQAVRMPAFGGRLGGREIADLVAFALAANAWSTPADALAQRGEEVARRHCLHCHNVGGAGGVPNPGSLFGYVPGLWGPDFADLVQNEQELREWIARGESSRVARYPFVRWFWRRQVLRMPAFEAHLAPEDVDAVLAYRSWLERTEGGVRAEEGQ
jgi:mono/diheme cytochrome c family protein